MPSPTPTLPDPIHPSLGAPLRERLADRAHAGLVLIVDDVPDNLAMLHDALDAAGYTVLVATEGASALQRDRQAGRILLEPVEGVAFAGEWGALVAIFQSL